MGITPRAPAVRRAVQALNLIAHSGDASLSDVARVLRLPKSSISDLVQTMLAERLVRRTEPGGPLALGDAVIEIAAGFVGNRGTLERFALEWDKGHPLVEHTLSVQSLIGDQSMCIDARIGQHILPLTPRAGSRLPVWNGAAGEPILTRLAPDAIENSLQRFGSFCGVDHEMQRSILDWARRHCTTGDSQPAPQVASSGNLELSFAIPAGNTASESVALTVHLPTRIISNNEAEAIMGALRTLARRLVA